MPWRKDLAKHVAHHMTTMTTFGCVWALLPCARESRSTSSWRLHLEDFIIFLFGSLPTHGQCQTLVQFSVGPEVDLLMCFSIFHVVWNCCPTLTLTSVVVVLLFWVDARYPKTSIYCDGGKVSDALSHTFAFSLSSRPLYFKWACIGGWLGTILVLCCCH